MKLQVNKHEDDRRVLTEWIADQPIRCCKVLIMKEDGRVGQHYHNNKVDTFYLLEGRGEYKIGDEEGQLVKGGCYRAEKGIPHTFYLRKGSILLEASSTPYDKTDEISIVK